MTLLILLIVALILRLPHLGDSFWLDEAAQALESARPLTQQHLIKSDFQPPLIHYLTHFALYFSSAEWWLRAIAALIPGLITIAAFYCLAKRWFSPWVATWSSLLLATSSLHIFFSQELRPYSLPAMFALLSWLCLDHLVKNKTKSNTASKKTSASSSTFAAWVGFTLTTTLGLYAGYLYPFVTLSQAIWLVVFHRRHWQKFLTGALVAALAFLPWLPSFLGQLQEGGNVRQQLPGWDQVVSLTQGKALFLTLGKFIFGMIKIDPSPLVFLASVGLSLVGLYLIKDLILAQKNPVETWLKARPKLLKVLIIWISPLVLAWLVSFIVPVLQPKRVLYLLPFFYLLIVALVEALPHKKAPLTLVALVLVINLAGTISYYFDKNLQREDWRTLHAQITQRFGNRQAIAIFSHPEAFSPWRWYDDQQFPSLATGVLSVAQIPDLRVTFRAISDYQYVLVFDYLRTLSDPQDLIIKEVSSYGFKEIEVIDTPNIGFVRVFARPETVLSSQPLEF